LQSLNYTVTADGNTVTIPALDGKTLVSLQMVGQIYDNSQISLMAGGVVNASEIGGFYDGNYLTIVYK